MSPTSLQELLARTARLAAQYRESLEARPVRPLLSVSELQHELVAPLTEHGESPAQVIEALARAGAAGSVASAGPRYFGFVIGGSTPAALAADWLVSAWDQNAGLYATSPLIAAIEEVTAAWLRELAGLPASMTVGFVTGCQMASFTALAAARHRVLRNAGWDVEAEGLFGAPAIEVLVSDEAHYTIFMALRLLGLGGSRLRRVPTDAQGRMRAAALGALLQSAAGPCIVCAQAGNVNSGAFDPLDEIAALTRERGAWLHVDGAFGLWAAAAPSRAGLVRGVERADSIATDAHKWLNVPYDCGIVFCADENAHRSAMTLAAPSISAPYLATSARQRDPHEFVPEESRRGRAVPVYAALRALGRAGVAELVERNCRQAQRFAAGLSAAGYEVLNEVVLNQVVVAFGEAERTRRVIAAVQEDGTCWCGATVWKGRSAMRISVSSWATTDTDVERSLAAILRVARDTT
ncbi:MAG TPA: aminotransferase class V-fold PLP-dependent enzyme [Steroidobacteraceae bacterium]|nr:aminotransferase class V-fold PLP-dependent enzyme [Steroidobacteraceae bacterium]